MAGKPKWQGKRERWNYAPFALRDLVYIAAGAVESVRADPLSASNLVNRTIIGDACIAAVTDWNSEYDEEVLARFGWKSKGYLLEERIPYQFFANGGMPMVSCWEFPRPYRIYPDEKLWAEVEPWHTDLANDATYGSILFNGVRTEDGLPHMLHDSNERVIVNGTTATLNGTGMECPIDSPVDLHCVTLPEYRINPITPTRDSMRVQVYGPDDRQWFRWQYRIPTVAAASFQSEQWWVQAPNQLIELGEDRGWVQEPGEAFICEFENQGDTYVIMSVLIRGCIEVEDPRWQE